MATLYTHQDSNIAKTWALMCVFFIGVIGLGWIFSYALDTPGLLPIAVLFAIVTNVGSFWWSDKLVVKLTGAKPADAHAYRELHNVVENLAITAGLPKPRVYIVEDPAPNAFATGRDAQHAVVAVTTGLLSVLDRTELEGVIAHELSHVGNRDMLVSTVAVVLVGFVAILSDFFLRITFWGGGGRSRDNDSKAGALLMVIALVMAVLAPVAASLMQLAISRKREFLADASGALLTRYPEGLANALRKISSYQAPMKKANNATAHLFISNPFGAAARKNVMIKLFSTHPPIEERIKALVGNE